MNDFKTKTSSGIAFAPSNWQRELDELSDLKGSPLIERFFDKIYRLMQEHPNSNVAGYALKRFSRGLLAAQNHKLLAEYLQRFLFAAPHLIRWIAPLYLGIIKTLGVTTDSKRALEWCIASCARRNDVGSLSWLLYSMIFLNLKLTKSLADACFSLSCPILDLQIFHLRALGLSSYPLKSLRDRYDLEAYDMQSWLILYEVERRSWDTAPAFKKIGTISDPTGTYASLAAINVEFYQTSQELFSPEAFDGWKLTNESFQVQQPHDHSALDYFQNEQLYAWEEDQDELYN